MADIAPEINFVKRPIMGGSPPPKTSRRPPPIAAMSSKRPKPIGPAQMAMMAAAMQRIKGGK